MDDDVHSFVINISKPRVYAKKENYVRVRKQDDKNSKQFSERLLFKKPSGIALKKYSLQGDKPLSLKALKREDLLLSYKQYRKRQDMNRHIHRLSINIYDKYKIINTDLRNRLQVDNLPNNIHAVTDFDNDYFKILSERQFRIPLFKSFRYNLDRQLRIKQDVGCRNDCVLNIESNNRTELQIYEHSLSKVTDQAKQFDKFISEDYLKSKALLEKWDELKIIINIKRAELENLAVEEFTIRSRLIGLDYLYGLQQKYGRFLYYLSPPNWRAKNRDFARSVEIEAKGFDFNSSNEADTFQVILEKLQKLCYSQYVQPALYFTCPRDLMEVFESIEKQELHHFTHVVRLAPHATALKANIKILKGLNVQDSALLANSIRRFEKLIEFCDERSNQLKYKFLKILNGMFYDSVGALDVLKFRMHLEFCFVKLYMENTANMDIVAIAKGLERLYLDYMKRIDAIQSSTVRKVISQSIATERQKFQRAKEANKELRLFDRLERELLSACASRPRKENLIFNVIKKPAVLKKIKKHYCIKDNKRDGSIRRDLTDAEKEYLTLFTDWRENEDPAKYLQSLSVEDDIKRDI